MNEEEKYYKLAIEIGEIIGKYGNNEQIELFQKILDDYKNKSSEYFKLKKENEELRGQVEQWIKTCCDFADEREKLLKTPVFTINEIKQLIGYEENEEVSRDEIISLLKTMWEEFNRLEDIEDRKVQIEYNNVFNKGVKSVEDKIRDKMKELTGEIHRTKKGRILIKDIKRLAKLHVLKELLGE